MTAELAGAQPCQLAAAVLVEPIQGEGGYLVAPDQFLARLRHLTKEHGMLLIADEVQSGMGRTGKMFAIEHAGVEPDIMCMAKGLGGGFPMGAFAYTKAIREVLTPEQREQFDELVKRPVRRQSSGTNSPASTLSTNLNIR